MKVIAFIIIEILALYLVYSLAGLIKILIERKRAAARKDKSEGKEEQKEKND